MENETKIKVPKKYQHMIRSILYYSGLFPYTVVLEKGYEGFSFPCFKYCNLFSSSGIFSTQKEVLCFIRSIRPKEESAPAPASEEIEEPAVEEDIANVEETAPEDRNEQGSVPTEMAVDAPAASPDQETKTSVVDDRWVAFTAIYSNGEIQTFFDGWSWRNLSQLVKWRLQYDRSVPETATVYAGDCARLVRTFTNSPVQSVAPG